MDADQGPALTSVYLRTSSSWLHAATYLILTVDAGRVDEAANWLRVHGSEQSGVYVRDKTEVAACSRIC